MSILKVSTLRKVPAQLALLSKQARQRLLAFAIWATLAVFCATALGHLYGQQRAVAIERDRTSANAAATFLAGQSLESIMAGDRISLQLISRQLLELPSVSGILIEDVESNTLAEVGDLKSGEAITEPVVLHDSIAGNITLALVPGSSVTFPWASLLLTLVFALPFSAAAALLAGSLSGGRKLSAETINSPAEVDRVAESSIGLFLRPLNWAQLGNQLSRSALEGLQRELDGRMRLLQRIYGAHSLSCAGPQVGLGFSGTDAAFRAVCCGLLLREMQSVSRATGMKLALAVVPSQPERPDFCADQLLNQSRGLFLHPELLEDTSLVGRIEHHGAGWTLEVTGLTPSYQKLLDSQLQQLLGAEATPHRTPVG
ncbi:hypothetical protein MO867_07165 [Microbulbifer sp. OS29]|uniref:Uncharacterized protein n=1 Tax=Microbulbifer okhotskensis TaxID=2926617 RepID=A0A9X2ELZ9_9GAMM|nr:hypothetical protein [Microbulbifer okhotskensis]MCO1334121.1 hypothetical protein [Microbulbifer okhotskensis]